MSFSKELQKSLEDLHLLKHPFYQAWSRGEVPLNRLKEYAAQYYIHVKAFPRYISAAHSMCPDLKQRRILLENLADEEGLHATPHPQLWMQFAKGLGLQPQEVEKAAPKKSIQKLIQTFFDSCRSSYAEGIASLYAYESQIPEVAETKIQGLKEHYGINDAEALSFFEVHKEADIHHRKALEALMDRFSHAERGPALKAAKSGGQALWDFLSDMHQPAEAGAH